MNVDELVPSEFFLSQNYPNPFKDKTIIKYCVPDKTLIKLTVFDCDMTIIRELENDIKEAGTYEVEFDGSSLKGGIYFYKFEAKGFNKIKEMTLAK